MKQESHRRQVFKISVLETRDFSREEFILKDYGTLEDVSITIKPEHLEGILQKTK